MIDIKTKILIIEKDIATINSISTLIAALNFEKIIFYNWNPKLKSYPKEEIITEIKQRLLNGAKKYGSHPKIMRDMI